MKHLAAVLMFLLVTLLSVTLLHAHAQVRVRRTSTPQSEAEGQLAAKTATIIGRCIDGVTGQPLSGCVVEVKASGSGMDAFAKELTSPGKVTTGPDGKFEVRVAAHETLQVVFEASLHGRWPRTGRWLYLAADIVEDVGDVALHPGVRAAGLVVDEQGKPVPGVTIGVNGLWLYLGVEKDVVDGKLVKRAFAEHRSRAIHTIANNVRWCQSDEDGTFVSEDALPPGQWPVRLRTRSVCLVGAPVFTIPEVGPMEPLTIVVRKQDYLGGVVVDATGQPIPGVRLHAEYSKGRTSGSLSGRTAQDGTFKIYRSKSASDKAKIRVMDPGVYERPAPTQEFAWGKKDIRIEMRPALDVAIRVVEAGSGKPVTEYAVRRYSLKRGASSSLSQQRLRHAGEHLGGKLTIRGVPRGRARIWVVPTDPKLHIEKVDVDAVVGMPVVEVEVTRLVPMIVQVLDDKASPVKNATVMVVEPGNRRRRLPMVEFRAVNPRADRASAFSSNPRISFDTLVHESKTDAGGQCIVYGIPGREDMILGVVMDGVRFHREEAVTFGPKGNGYTVRLPSPARQALVLMIARTEMEVESTYLPGSEMHQKSKLKLELLRKNLRELDERAQGGR